MLNNVEFYNTFYLLKKALVTRFFKDDNIYKVARRINYYDFIIGKKNVPIKFPKETCLEKMYRILIKREPPPYHSDYREIGTDVSDLHEYLIYTTRTKYGYSRRFTTSTISTTTSDENSRESKHQMKVSIQSQYIIKKLTLQKKSTHSNQILPSKSD